MPVQGASLGTQPFFSVIIVNYNGGDLLQKAVESLEAQTFSDFEVWVVDNDSTDGSLEKLDLSRLHSAQLVCVGRNSGFAEGNNIAARQAKGKWLALLNCDAMARPDWLEVLRSSIEKYPDVSMFASTQIRMDTPELMDGAGDCYSAYGFPWRGGYLWPVSALPQEGECFAPCGASAAYKTDVFLAHNGFDERYFCFVEDIDLAYRMRLAGERCIFLPTAVVTHKGGGLSGENSPFSAYHGARNRIWTYIGDTPSALLWLTLPMHFVLSLYLVLHHMFSAYGKAMRKGMWDGWKSAGRVRAERKSQRVARKASLSDLMRALSWNVFWIKSHKPDVRSK